MGGGGGGGGGGVSKFATLRTLGRTIVVEQLVVSHMFLSRIAMLCPWLCTNL